MQRPLYKIILCDVINPKNDTKCQFIQGGAIVLKRRATTNLSYNIEEIGKEREILRRYGKKRSLEVIDMIGRVALPGFFDMHFHWVQDDVREMPKENLLNWLSKYTWPHEAKFKDKKYSLQRSKSFAEKLLAVGTLGGACYSSIHGHAVDHALNSFVGDFIVGNVLMTMNSPEYLTQTKKNAISLVGKKSEKYKKRYALTPRFAITTDPDVMTETARIAKKNGSFIQTHLDETKNEIEFVLDIYRNIEGFKDPKTYTEIYDRCNHLGPKTIMGHCIHLEDSEIKLLKKSNTAIAHCPSSNAPVKELGLGSGLFDFKRVEKNGIRWALASDIGGGPYLSMFDVMRSFVLQNKKKGNDRATYVKALYRSTLAGAEILGVSSKAGSLDSGKRANMIFAHTPKVKGKATAETILRAIVESNKNNRDQYIGLIEKTMYEGIEVYSS